VVDRNLYITCTMHQSSETPVPTFPC